MKILIFYTAHTLGHKQIAENVAYWIRKSGHTVVLEDVLQTTPSKLVKHFLKVHVWVNRHTPWVWGFLYKYGFWFSMPFRLLVAKKFLPDIAKRILLHKPDVVITTQTSASAVMSLAKKNLFNGRWLVAFSDFHFHPYWVYPRADGYMVNIEEQKKELVRRGIPSENILIIGMALFPEQGLDRQTVRSKFGVSPDEKLLLVNVGGGTLGLGLSSGLLLVLQNTLKLALARGVKMKVVVACGKDKKLLEDLTLRCDVESAILPIGFYSPFREVIRAVDASVGKVGGLTTAECLYEGVAVIVTDFLAGQEEENIKYLERRGLVMNLTKQPKGLWPEQILQALLHAKGSKIATDSGKPIVSRQLEYSITPFLQGFYKEI